MSRSGDPDGLMVLKKDALLVLLVGALVCTSCSKTSSSTSAVTATADNPSPSPTTAASSLWVSGFYPGWGYSTYPPSDVDFSSLTHLVVFAAIPQSDGTLDTDFNQGSASLGQSMVEAVVSATHSAGKKAILAVGGSSTQSAFEGATSSTNLDSFAQAISTYAQQNGFDGIDLDWEPLQSADYSAFSSLVNKLKSLDPSALITMDVGVVNTNFPLSSTDESFYAAISATVDQMNIMSYGMAGAWSGWVSWHNSPIYGSGSNHPDSIATTVSAYSAAGVPVSKLGLGIGFFGSCWTASVTGPLQTIGSSTVACGDSSMSYATIMESYYSAADYHYDSSAQQAYLSFSSPVGSCSCTFISYDDATSIAAKGSYAKSEGLGGAIIWELSEGYDPSASDPSSALHAVKSAFLQ